MPRPSLPLPDDFIAFMGRQGAGAPAIHEALRARGFEADQRTVGRRLERLRADGWPGADAYAATQRAPGGAVGAGATAAPTTPADASSPASRAAEALDELELERLPAELLAEAARETKRALELALRQGEVTAADKLAGVLERFARRLVEVRPPEKVEPIKDPVNVAARREILARWDALREPLEVSSPVVDAIQAHVDRLRARLAAQDSDGST